MKVCCGNGKPYDILTDIEKLGCNHDHCTGPTNIEQRKTNYDSVDTLRLEGFGMEEIDHWKTWIITEIKEGGVQSYKEWYDRMLLRTNGNLHPDFIKAHNKLFGENE